MSEKTPTVPVEEIARFPRPGTAVPTRVRFGPGDRILTWLASPEGTLRQALFALDLDTGARRVLLDPGSGGTREGEASLEEALRRERLRERAVGVTSYAWAEVADRILVPLGGALLVVDGAEAGDPRVRELVPAGGPPILDARLSPDGGHVGFVRDAELYVVGAEGGEPLQVTRGARGTGRTHGLAEYAAQEEMHRREGWWWSPDGELLAFAQVDETHIPAYRIVHQGKDAVGEGAQEDHRYPFAGCANAKVRLGVVSRQGGEPVWMDLGPFEYLARVAWLRDGHLVAQLQDRLQRTLDVVRLDPRTGARTLLHREQGEPWINLHDLLKPLRDGGFLWASERTGFRHLEVRAADGGAIRSLTRGNWMVEADGVPHVDEAGGFVYFLGTRDGAEERHLYRVPLAGGEVERLTEEPGMHGVAVDRGARRFVDLHHALDRPPTLRVRSIPDGAVLHTIHDAPDPRVAALDLRPPELLRVEGRDGTPLAAAIYRPDGEGPFPTIVSVYGGPHVQRVANAWDLTADVRAQHLRSLGFLVLVLDNRGSARRGLAFESALHGDMGNVEVRDQVDGVHAMVARGLADPDRVGIYGWSYGGYMAAMCLARAPDVFRAACAGAPVTHWDGYDTHYTERYMGLPQDNAAGYERSSVMHHVGGMRGALLLVHGLLDENVHFRHTARLVNALIRARKPYELLLFPDERHMPRGEADRVYMEERIRDFFLRELAGPSRGPGRAAEAASSGAAPATS